MSPLHFFIITLFHFYIFLILVKPPRLAILAQQQPAAVQPVYPDADIVEGSEAKGPLHYSCVGSTTMNGVALDEKAVTLMLEIAKHMRLSGAAHQRQRARETDILRVGTFGAPLAEQVACFATLLTGCQEETRKQNQECLKVFSHDN